MFYVEKNRIRAVRYAILFSSLQPINALVTQRFANGIDYEKRNTILKIIIIDLATDCLKFNLNGVFLHG